MSSGKNFTLLQTWKTPVGLSESGTNLQGLVFLLVLEKKHKTNHRNVFPVLAIYRYFLLNHGVLLRLHCYLYLQINLFQTVCILNTLLPTALDISQRVCYLNKIRGTSCTFPVVFLLSLAFFFFLEAVIRSLRTGKKYNISSPCETGILILGRFNTLYMKKCQVFLVQSRGIV